MPTSPLGLGIEDLANAIEREENVNPAYNNPGAIMSNGQLKQYPTYNDGYNALTNLLSNAVTGNSKYYNPNMSLEQFEQTYTGGDTNAGSNVASMLGVSPSTPIGTFGSTPSASQPTPSTTGSATSTGTSTPSSTAINKMLSTVQQFLGIPSGDDLATIIAIIVGVILIAGAVFGFRQVTTTVVEGTRKGVELAAA